MSAQILAKRQGKHLSLEYGSSRELGSILAQFVHEGLQAGEKVACLTKAGPATVTGWLTAEGVAWERALARGALVLMCTDDLSAGAHGSYVAGVLAGLEDFVASGASEGYPGVRIASEDGAWDSCRETVEQMRLREHAADALVATHRATRLCLYDRRRFGREFLRAVAGTHDQRDPTGVLYADGLVTMTRPDGRRQLAVSGEVDISNAAALHQILMNGVGDSPHGLKVDASELCFIDAAGLRVVIDVAVAVPATVLFVVNTRPRVQRLVGICGYDQLPNLAFFPDKVHP